jgi:hypothetical protein
VDSSSKLLVLGYTLEQQQTLPSQQALEEKMTDKGTAVALATSLADNSFIDPAYAGQLSAGLTVEKDSQTYVQQLIGDSPAGSPQLQLAPIAGGLGGNVGPG